MNIRDPQLMEIAAHGFCRASAGNSSGGAYGVDSQQLIANIGTQVAPLVSFALSSTKGYVVRSRTIRYSAQSAS